MHLLNSPFGFLSSVPTRIVAAALGTERADVIAITLSQMNGDQIPDVFRQLGPALKREVANSLSTLKPVSATVLRQVAAGIFVRVQKLQQQGGLVKVLEILRECDREVEEAALERLSSVDPTVVTRIQSCLLTFGDLSEVNDYVLRTLLRNIDLRTWAMALKRSDEKLKRRVSRQLTAQAVRALSDEIDYLGSVTSAEIAASQQRIVDIARMFQYG